MDLSIIIPAYNEAESLPNLFREIHQVCDPLNFEYEMIVVDDGSSDNTFGVIRQLAEVDTRIVGLRFRRNCGKAAALQTGFDHAEGKYIITMDADLQDNPAEIPEFLEYLKNRCDMVSGWKKKRYDPWHKTLPSKLFNQTVRKVTGLKLHDFNCGLKGYKKEVVKSLNLYGELHRYIPVLAHWNGFRVEEKVVEHRARQYGVSKYGWTRLSNGLFDLLTLLFLHRYMARPLHLFGFLGLLTGGASTAILGYFFLKWAITGSLHNRPLLIGAIGLLLLGAQLISLGLIAELVVGRSPQAFPVGERCGRQVRS